MNTHQNFKRHEVGAWAKVLREELPQLTEEQAEAHLAAALKDVSDGAREEERNRCAEMVEDIILLLIERYKLVGSKRSCRALAKAIAALEEDPIPDSSNGHL